MSVVGEEDDAEFSGSSGIGHTMPSVNVESQTAVLLKKNQSLLGRLREIERIPDDAERVGLHPRAGVRPSRFATTDMCASNKSEKTGEAEG